METFELRDRFAEIALPSVFEAIMSNRGIPGDHKARFAAQISYEIADAMIAARKKRAAE